MINSDKSLWYWLYHSHVHSCSRTYVISCSLQKKTYEWTTCTPLYHSDSGNHSILLMDGSYICLVVRYITVWPSVITQCMAIWVKHRRKHMLDMFKLMHSSNQDSYQCSSFCNMSHTLRATSISGIHHLHVAMCLWNHELHVKWHKSVCCDCHTSLNKFGEMLDLIHSLYIHYMCSVV